MRILHLVARLNDGGPARVIGRLAAAHAAAGHQVRVLAGTCGPDERDIGDEVLPGLVERVGGLGRAIAPLHDLGALAALLPRLRAVAPDLVHTHTAKAGAIGRLACRALGIPCLHTYHGHVLHGYWSRPVHAAFAQAERLCAGNAWHHALTPGQLHELRDLHGIGRPARWAWLPPPVPRVRPLAASWHAGLPAGLPRILWLGRLTEVKDPGLWLATLAALNRIRPVHAVICGDGGMRAAAEAQAAALGIDATWTGFVPAGEALGCADLLLMTSRNEGLPLSAIEAAGAGVPVVAPAVGGLADAARWGVVTAAGRTPEALAAACAAALARPRPPAHPLALALASAKLADRYLALYRRVAACP